MPFDFSRVICLLFVGCCLYQASSGQVLVKLVKHYADQDKACAEFDKCLTKLEASRKNVPSDIKVVELGPGFADIKFNHLICARQSNCRCRQRAFCEPHVGPNGTTEMQFLCKIGWLSGSNDTDKSDPITSFLMEEDQIVAASNYEKCLATPNEEIPALKHVPHDEALGHVPKIAKQILCSIRMNSIKHMKAVCDEERVADMGHRIAKIVSVFCSLVPYAEIEARNSAGSRSLGGTWLKSTSNGGCLQVSERWSLLHLMRSNGKSVEICLGDISPVAKVSDKSNESWVLIQMAVFQIFKFHPYFTN